MITTVWSVKGGSGVSVVSAALAAIHARRRGNALLVDLARDQPALLGLREPSGPGVLDWLATVDGSPTALDRLRVDAGAGLHLLPTGTAPTWPTERTADLVAALATASGPVVVDAGAGVEPASALAGAGASILVIRPCYLALRRAMQSTQQADGIVLVVDAGRALDRRDVEQVLGVPVLCSVDVDPAVARAVDAGLLVPRVPRLLERALRAAT